MAEFFPANGYRLKTPFWTRQQKRLFDRSIDKPKFAIFHEPRVGKSDPTVVTACYHHEKKDSPLHVRGVLIVSWPSGAQYGWIRDAFPQSATVPWAGLPWETSRSRSRTFKRAFKELCSTDKLAVFSLPGDALISEYCREMIGAFAKARGPLMVVGDEISSIANTDARRARIMHNIGRLPVVKIWRILDGTPVDRKGPLDFYSEFLFMGPEILGYANEVEFREHYAEIPIRARAPFWAEVKRHESTLGKEGAIRHVQAGGLEDEGKRRKTLRGRDWWPDVKAMRFRNMDELWRRLDPVSDRCTYAEAFPDAAAQVFAKRYFELTAEQRRVYDEIEEEHRSEVDGVEIAAKHHLTRVLRLQQVASNYFPDGKVLKLCPTCEGLGCDDCDEGVVQSERPLKLIDKTNPRVDALVEELKEGKPTIVWVRFRQDGEFALEALRDRKPIRFFGKMTANERENNYRAFQEERKSDVIVAQWTRGARARRFDYADKHVAMSNQFSFRTRVQAQQRTEHGSKKYATSFVDLVAVDTVDDNVIIPALRLGMDVSTFINRDARREWI